MKTTGCGALLVVKTAGLLQDVCSGGCVVQAAVIVGRKGCRS